MEEWRTDGLTERNGGIHGIFKNTEYMDDQSGTSRKRTPLGPRVSVRLRKVSAYGRVKKKCTRGHIMHQNKYFKTLRPLVTQDQAPVVNVLSIKGLLDIA